MVQNVYVSAVTTDNISRHELVAWVNTLLQSQLSKIEEMSTGAAYCQLTHILFPENISLKKVKWNSKSDMDHINNWKILGVAWKEIGVDKPVQVERMVKAKFQDNYEFLQWFYKFFNANGEGADIESYDALGHRGGEAFPAGAKGPAAGRTAMRPAAPRPTPAAAPKKLPTSSPAVPKPVSAAPAGGSAADKATIKKLENQINEHIEALETAERERDFYFQKLRMVEDMCNALGEDEILDAKKVLNILYASGEEEDVSENVAPAEEPVPADNLDESETF